MDEEDDRGVRLWSGNGLTVWAALDDGELTITGEDLNAQELFGEEVSEYAYGLTVAPEDVPRVLEALDVAEGVGVIDALVLRGADLVKIGEAAWLESIGVEAEFWSRIS